MAPSFTGQDGDPNPKRTPPSYDHWLFSGARISADAVKGSYGTRADQLRAEEVLCTQLREQKFQGLAWDFFVHELLAYGIDRIRMLIVTGIIFHNDKWDETRRRFSRHRWDVGDVEDLTADVVLAGFKLFFKKGMVGQQWSPTAGASLTTYFIGACKLTFNNTYRTWLRCHKHRYVEIPTDDLVTLPPDWRESDENVQTMLDLLTEKLTRREIELLLYVSEGYTYADIGKNLGLTTRAVEARLYRARKKAQQFLCEYRREAQ